MTWDIMNIAARLGVVIFVIIKLTMFREMYKRGQRIGLGIAGGSALMTVPVIWYGPGGPFDEWAGACFALGIAIYFAGSVWRHTSHARANAIMVKRALQRYGQ